MLPGVRLARSGASVIIAVAAVAVACGGSEASSDAPIRLPDRASADGGSSDAETASDTSVAMPVDANACKTNGVKDGVETDIDCGGPDCPPCAIGRACESRRDCTSLVCAGLKCSGDLGCSDATREGFAAIATYPNIAACAGAWSFAGLLVVNPPTCLRTSGNDSQNTIGAGCNVTDLCQVGWHVCVTAAEVGVKSGAAGCADTATAGSFFVTRQSGAGEAACGAGANDLFGCGGVGAAPDAATCGPLDRFSNDLCVDLPAEWSCGADGLAEANNVTKTGSAGGGVLCCRD